MSEPIFLEALSALLFVSAIAHFFIPHTTEKWMSNPLLIRLTGAILITFAVICLRWHDWFIHIIAALLAISGFWRLLFPNHSARTQANLYPRWVHGILLLAGAIALFVLRHKQ